jgi:cysteine synthase
LAIYGQYIALPLRITFDSLSGMPISTEIARKTTAIDAMVGNTPLLAVHFRFHGQLRVLYAKAEYMNLTGSIKDRMALHVLKCAYKDGRIRPGDTIAEATSGNTGIAFSAIGRALGHPVVIYMPDWMSSERVSIIRSLGAKIQLVSKEQGGFLGSIELCERLARDQPNIFLPRQFSNEANVEAHELTTGPEIAKQIESIDRKVDAFVAGVGTGGTVMGVGRYLRDRYRNVRVHPLEPAESPTLTTGVKVGRHRIQGIADEFIPAICQLNKLDAVIAVSDGDAILMAQKLASVLGLGVGVSSGANFLGALMVQESLGAEATVASIFCDDNRKYLSTDLVRAEPVKSGYLSPEIELVRYEALAGSR